MKFSVQRRSIEDSKLIQTLRGFSQKSISELGKWLDSPFCNSQKNLGDFYALLLPHFPRFNSGNLDKVLLFDQLFPASVEKEDSFKDKRIRNLMTDMLRQIERMWVVQKLHNDRDLQLKLLGEIFLSKAEIPSFERVFGERLRALQVNEKKSSEDLLGLYETNAQTYFGAESIHKKKLSVIPEALHEADRYLDEFYLLSKLRILAEINERKYIVGRAKDTGIGMAHLNDLAKKSDHPVSRYYLSNLQNEAKTELEQIREKKNFYLANHQDMPTNDQKDILMLLINQVMRNTFLNLRTKLEVLFELFQTGLENDAFLEGGKMTSTTFANIVTVGNQIGQTATIRQFIDTYLSRLLPEVAPEARRWSLAHSCYYQGQLDNCQEYLDRKRFRSKAFEFRARILRLQFYFDRSLEPTRFSEVFMDYTYAFEQFIRRDSVSTEKRKESTRNLIRFARRLLLIRIKGNHIREEIECFRLDLEAVKNIHAKLWLMERADRI